MAQQLHAMVGFGDCQAGLHVLHWGQTQPMSTITAIEGAEHVPNEPMLVIPNRLDLNTMQVLEKELGGERRVAWLVENSLRPDAEIMRHLQKKKASGIIYSMEQHSSTQLQALMQAKWAAGQHVVLLTGRPVQPPAYASDVPPGLLNHLLQDHTRPVLPVYVGMYNPDKAPLVTSAAPYEKALVRVLPVLAACPPAQMQAGLQAAWLSAGTDQVSHLLAERAEALPQVLLRHLLACPQATIIDGVDDTRMTYRQLLVLAAPLARRLRKIVINKRLGIVLPPGKYAIVANVACLLVGITPVNIDYTYTGPAFDNLCRLADINRIITEHRFMKMMPDFPWPLTRDIFFIDDALAGSSRFRLPGPWNMLRRWITPKRIAKWLNASPPDPQSEVLAVFSPAEDGVKVSGVSLSHRAVLAGAALSYSRFGLGEGQRVLSAMPLHYKAGLLAGLIHPLLMGQDIVTYPLADASKRLCQLARQYKPALAVFTPAQTADILSSAQEGDFDATSYFVVAGKVHAHTAKRVFQEHRIYLCECYLPPESAMPLACNMAPPQVEKTDDATHAHASGAPGTVGVPLPGVAIRITDLEHDHRVLPVSTPGLLWVKGPGLFSHFIGQEPPPASVQERWICTGDVAQLREDGLLAVGGPRERYSRVNGELISHEMVEHYMLRFLRVEEERGKPRLAVVSMVDEQTGQDQLVLLSTVHRVVGPHDVITLRYDLTNAHISPNLAPGRIIALRAIPTLPSGKVDYPTCRAVARQVLGSSASSRHR